MKKDRFQNLDPSDPKGFLTFLKWKMRGKSTPWPKKVENTLTASLPAQVASGEVFATFINHSTVLLQLDKLNVLTDPIFSDIAGPYSFLGPRRVRSPGVAFQELPKIDVVLLSHNHYDHLDIPSIQKLWKRDHPLFIVPLRNGKLVRSYGVDKVIELDWWQEYRLNAQQSFILTPAKHWSRRGLLDYCKALWGGFVLQSPDLKIFFAGDTAYGEHFKMIKERFGAMNLSLLPIGAYEPRWFMKEFHMNPAEAVQAHLDLESRLSMGIHFGTFPLTDEAIDDPIKHLEESLRARNLTNFIAPDHGQTICFTKECLKNGPL
ncbi:MAG TPA: MBL fold metallo-hydrolase [Rhabdochlamydiaceae bacterium]|nr:MBL fold metallo-hydrolase [Rhabdochlamydiaceae bacterium]